MSTPARRQEVVEVRAGCVLLRSAPSLKNNDFCAIIGKWKRNSIQPNPFFADWPARTRRHPFVPAGQRPLHQNLFTGGGHPVTMTVQVQDLTRRNLRVDPACCCAPQIAASPFSVFKVQRAVIARRANASDASSRSPLVSARLPRARSWRSSVCRYDDRS